MMHPTRMGNLLPYCIYSTAIASNGNCLRNVCIGGQAPIRRSTPTSLIGRGARVLHEGRPALY